MHMNKEKASQNQVKPEETPLARSSRSPNGSTIPKNNPRDEKFYTVHFDVQAPVQPSAGMGDTSAGRQKIVSVASFAANAIWIPLNSWTEEAAMLHLSGQW